MACPCKDCQKRCVGCHSKCEDYLKWQEEHNKTKELEKQQIQRDCLGSDWLNNNYATKRRFGKK